MRSYPQSVEINPWLQEALESFICDYTERRFEEQHGAIDKQVYCPSTEVLAGMSRVVVRIDFFPASLTSGHRESVEFWYTPRDVLELFLLCGPRAQEAESKVMESSP
jgi:hypothetical protein